jgi:uncharacterized protein YcaQ
MSLAQARRVALAAQGFLDPAPAGLPDRRLLRRALRRTGLLQIDSVNVLQRAHYVPLYSRLGAYPTDLLDRMAYETPRDLFEYWAHEASLVPVSLHPALRWRMARPHPWAGVRRIAERTDLLDRVFEEVRDRGPLTAGQIEQDVPRPTTGNWGWNWSDTKIAIEALFWRGEVSVLRRNTAFARVYDLTERVLPAAVLDAPTLRHADACRELVRVAAVSLGVATEGDLRDYFRLPVDGARAAVSDLVDAGELVPVEVEGWRQPAYLHAEARLPRRVNAATLVSPFDPLVWERSRVARLFDFGYKIEIYVPAAQRVHGYYVLPFLLGDRLVARVDLKADRKAGVLRVPAAWIEPVPVRVRKGAPDVATVAAALATELHRFAGWLGLGEVDDPVKGDLAPDLTKALASESVRSYQPLSASRAGLAEGQEA